MISNANWLQRRPLMPKMITEIVANNIVASWPPELRPTAMLTAHATLDIFEKLSPPSSLFTLLLKRLAHAQYIARQNETKI